MTAAAAAASCSIEPAEGLLGEPFTLSAGFSLAEALPDATWQVR